MEAAKPNVGQLRGRVELMRDNPADAVEVRLLSDAVEVRLLCDAGSRATGGVA
jgi:hypothetical protein